MTGVAPYEQARTAREAMAKRFGRLKGAIGEDQVRLLRGRSVEIKRVGWPIKWTAERRGSGQKRWWQR